LYKVLTVFGVFKYLRQFLSLCIIIVIAIRSCS